MEITVPPHVDRRVEILQTLDEYSTTTRQPHLTIDPLNYADIFPIATIHWRYLHGAFS